MREITEQQHLKNLSEGHVNGFNWLFNQYHHRVFGLSLKFVNDPSVAEEITTDVFVKLWEKRAMVDPEQPISHLLFKITKDFVWNYLKKANRISRQREAYLLSKPAPIQADEESDLILKDYLSIADAAIEQLPAKCKAVFKLHQSGLDNTEIARQLNITEPTVRNHLFRANRYLRAYLGAHPEIQLFMVFLAGGTF